MGCVPEVQAIFSPKLLLVQVFYNSNRMKQNTKQAAPSTEPYPQPI